MQPLFTRFFEVHWRLILRWRRLPRWELDCWPLEQWTAFQGAANWPRVSASTWKTTISAADAAGSIVSYFAST